MEKREKGQPNSQTLWLSTALPQHTSMYTRCFEDHMWNVMYEHTTVFFNFIPYHQISSRTLLTQKDTMVGKGMDGVARQGPDLSSGVRYDSAS